MAGNNCCQLFNMSIFRNCCIEWIGGSDVGLKYLLKCGDAQSQINNDRC